MTREELIKAFVMKVDGHTYREIGKEMGCSHENIHNELKNALGAKTISADKTVYPNLIKEIKVRYKSLPIFCETVNLDYRHFYSVLKGKVQPTGNDVFVCCKHLDMDWSYLFEKVGEQK